MHRFAFLFIVGFILFLACNATPINKAETVAYTSNESKAEAQYNNYCSGCHGKEMQTFIDHPWKNGDTPEDLFKSIKYGKEAGGMPAFEATFSDQEIKDIVVYIQKGIKEADRYKFSEKFDQAKTYEAGGQSYKVEEVATGIKIPWAMAFLPEGDLLVTDRGGDLFRVKMDGSKEKINGVPDVLSERQGGLLDLRLHPDFAQNQMLYLSYSTFKKENGKTLSTTRVSRAQLQGNTLKDGEVIFTALPYSNKRHHYGSRLEFDQEGLLYITVGDRGNRDENPQSLDNHCGKVHRVYDDGRVPESNPFVRQTGALSTIYSYGHRNQQGMIRHPKTGDIWAHEHGPRGGDELNVIRKGHNYGWPVISYGINYNGSTFTDISTQKGMDQPFHYWVPSIAPSGMAFITGDKYPAWKGGLLIGSLRFEYLNLCWLNDQEITKQELLLKGIGRVRSVEMGPDGYIYVGAERPGKIYRIVPVTN